MPSEPILSAQGVSAGYGGDDIVTKVSLEVAKGEMVVLLGPNGAGKSTLMKAIVGLIPRSSGRIELRGYDASPWPTARLVREGLSYVPQLRNVFGTLTVMENLEIGGYLLGSKARARADELMDLFPVLRHAARRSAGSLSGGERTLLALARGLMPRPNVLLADEPTAGLSPKNELVVWEHLELIRKTGVSILAVEQNVARALQYCDRAYVLVLGEVVFEGLTSGMASDKLAALYVGEDRVAARPKGEGQQA